MLGCFSRLKRASAIHAPPVKFSSHDAGEPSTGLYKSFNSLFEPTSDSDTATPSSSQTLTLASTSVAEHDLISSAIASGRLFSASPGRSNSIIDSPAVIIRVGSAGVAVSTYSPDPYSDFRQSMEEMATSLGISGRRTRLDLVVLRELLFCYLALNRKHAHKYIVSAFADLLASLSSGDEKSSGDE
ncbi:hypothetical protein KSP40_PGU010887 [Platanthera guangdongensis]|uniref:Transcription repressor n=1 Tax=Platanthera guangdongensis TaxID=2320717 RepID=A0ABR2MFW5_9ASPA